MADWLSSPVADRFTLALVHFLWQGALIGLAYRMLLGTTDIRSARARYAAALLTLCAVALCPVLTFAALSRSSAPLVVREEPGIVSGVAGSRGAGGVPMTESPRDGSAIGDRSIVAPVRSGIGATQPYVLLAWLAGVLALSARLVTGAVNLAWLRSGRTLVPDALERRSRRIARRLGLQSVRIRASVRVGQAAVVGFFRPVVLLPASWLTELPVETLEAVIAHELAHIRRCDVWVNLLQRILETLLFYHPVVWWLSNQVRRERELCCDELAVSATGARGGYAMALEQVGRMQVQGSLQLTPAFTGERRMYLLHRIQYVLGSRGKPERDSASLAGILAVSIPVVLAAIAFTTMGRNVATAQEREREGGRSAEPDTAPRRSAEAEAEPRSTPEADRGPQRSAEAEAGERRPAERDGTRLIESFEPQTEREAALFELIQQLRREIATLRAGRPAGDDVPRDGDRERVGPRDGEAAPGLGREERRQARTFQTYDRDGDGEMTLVEFNGLFEGNQDKSAAFAAADGDGDGKLSQAEFIKYRLQPRPRTEGDAPREGERRRDGDADRRGNR